MKVVALKVAGSDREPLILELRPGMTARDLLAEADLTTYVLARTSDPMNYLLSQEVLYDLLTDCETLIATLSPEAIEKADAYIRGFFTEEGDL